MDENIISELDKEIFRLRMKFPDHVILAIHKSTPVQVVINLLERLKKKGGVMN